MHPRLGGACAVLLLLLVGSCASPATSGSAAGSSSGGWSSAGTQASGSPGRPSSARPRASVPHGNATSATGPAGVSPSATGLSVIVVESAEAGSDGTDDPQLTPTGTTRALRLARVLANQPGVAVFVNQFQRSQGTGLPTARSWNVAPSLYDATAPADTVAATVRAQYRSGRVLIVGQQDSTPQIVRALCDCSVSPIAQRNFSTMFRIDFDGARPSVQRHSVY